MSTILFVLLVAHLPVAMLAEAGHDDAWFWRHGASLASGHWMGGYDHTTLIKGSGYPLFLAVVHLLGMQVNIAEALLHAGACLLFGLALYRMTHRPALALLVALALQWHPAALAWSRALRDNVGAAQVLLVLACLLNFLFATRVGRRGWRWAAGAGLALAWFWSTREDGIWLLPGVAVLVSGCCAGAWGDRAEARRLAGGSALMAVVFAAWLALVAGVNLSKYGLFVTVETRESAYTDAVSALQRVRVGEPVPYVPVPQPVREAVYAVSPSFARLRPHFEGAGRVWTGPGCALYAHTCGDYAGGWFMWALRDAAQSIGAYASASSADAYFAGVASEIGRACDERRLHCVSPIVAVLPPVAASQWRTLPERLGVALSLLTWQHIGDGQTDSHVGSRHVVAMWRFLGEPLVPDPADTLGSRASGWYRDAGNGWLALRCTSAPGVQAVERQPSPDLVGHFGDPHAGANRFTLVVPALDACMLETANGAHAVPLPIDGEADPDLALGTGVVHVDSVQAGLPR
ncbi:MAG TPA: hypothetical protein VLK29_12990, partial [Luteimonas sp.]|nr:hypothetical protein [Luteimonas sp.]